MMQRIRQRIRKRPWMVPALLLVLVFAMGLLVEAIKPMGGSAAKAGERFSDPPTNASKDYEDALGSPSSTRFNGRVWADKTVYTGDATVESSSTSEGEDTKTIEIGDDDFLISYSLLAATTVVEGQSLVPLDVVFVIDLSNSMKGDKIQQTVEALNQSVHTLMTGNPDTRIGVVTYNDEAYVLLPLDHYTKISETEDYFSLSETGDSLKVAVKNSKGNIITKPSEDDNESVTMGQWTNIHMGIDMGMDLLLNVSENDTTTISGDARYPALMLMSDGAPTASGDDTSDWWNPSGVSGDGDINFSGLDAFKAVMNAAYQKQRVSQHYKQDMKVYTVGVGVESWSSTDDRQMAEITLDPEKWKYADSPDLKKVWEQWEIYQTGADVTIGYSSREYTFTHPPTGDVDSLFYNDAYFSAKNPEDISDAFQQVLNQIVVSGAVPTQVEGDPAHSGYITYVDHIGQYMQVTAMRELVYKGRVYALTDTQTSGNKTTYIYSGGMDHPIYDYQSVSNILITLTTASEYPYDQTLEVKVPATLIPLRTNDVTLNEDGTVKENVCKNNTPLRLFYTVSLRDEVVTTINNQRYANISRLSSEYIKNHTNEDGSIRFNPNLYTGYVEDQAGVGKTVGNAYVYFQAADTNPFYYVQKDTPVYADEGCNTPATDKNGNLYVQVTYYDGTEIVTKAVPVTSIYDLEDVQPNPEDGPLYLEAESRYQFRDCPEKESEDHPEGEICNDPEHHHHNSDCDDVMDKGDENNLSETAETYRYPIYIEAGSAEQREVPPPYGSDGEPGNVLGYLGNNGVVSLPVLTGDLSISKTVTGNMLEKVENQEFIFDINVYYENSGTRANLNGTYETSANGGGVVQPSTEPSFKPGEETITFVDGKAQVTLSHGESITVHDLPAGYTYVVTEQDPNPDSELNIYNGEDYKVSVTQSTSAGGETATNNGEGTAEAETSVYTCTGTIQADRVETVAYTNKLYVPMVPYSFTKVDGLSFSSEDLSKAIALPGAQFVLYHYDGKEENWAEDSKELIDLSNLSDVWEDPITATSDAQGETRFENLQEGHYRLVETEAPEGYQLPTGQWNLTVDISGDEGSEVGTFVVQSTEDATMDTPAMAIAKEASGENTYYLMNYKPINPPITGGDGGEDFRIGGGLLMFTGLVLACWWMWSSPRRRSEFL